MVKCSMCMFEGGDSLAVLKHIVKRHKNNPIFHVQCQFEGCASSYQKWDSYRKHLSRKHGNVVPPEAFEEETLDEPMEEFEEPIGNVPPNIPPEIGNVQEDNDLVDGMYCISTQCPFFVP